MHMYICVHLHVYSLMFLLQEQFRYKAVQALISHLDKRGNIHIANPAAKRGILDTVSQCIEVASEGFLGPSAMDAFTVLLKHLKASLDECSIRDATIETLVRCKVFVIQAIVFAELSLLKWYMKILPYMYINACNCRICI